MCSQADEPVFYEAAAAVRAMATGLLLMPGIFFYELLRSGWHGWWPSQTEIIALLMTCVPSAVLFLTVRPIRFGRPWAFRTAGTILFLVGGVLVLATISLVLNTFQELSLNDTATKINIPKNLVMLPAVVILLTACALSLRHLWFANDADGVLNGPRGFAVETSSSAEQTTSQS